MTKIYNPGDKSRAICGQCAQLVTTTFVYRNVPFDDGQGEARNILVAACDTCGQVVAIPAQSTPAIRRARETASTSLEVVLPAPFVDLLDAAAFKIDSQATTQFRKALFVFYLDEMPQEAEAANLFKKNLELWNEQKESAFLHFNKKDIPNKRISFKLSPRTEHQIDEVISSIGISKTKLMRGIIMKAERDILLDAAPGPIKQLQKLAAVVNA